MQSMQNVWRDATHINKPPHEAGGVGYKHSDDRIEETEYLRERGRGANKVRLTTDTQFHVEAVLCCLLLFESL